MRVYTRDIADPLGEPQQNGSRGALQIVDLANKDSCCFLAISDQGRVFENGTFGESTADSIKARYAVVTLW